MLLLFLMTKSISRDTEETPDAIWPLLMMMKEPASP
jgi:hypothetical protein